MKKRFLSFGFGIALAALSFCMLSLPASAQPVAASPIMTAHVQTSPTETGPGAPAAAVASRDAYGLGSVTIAMAGPCMAGAMPSPAPSAPYGLPGLPANTAPCAPVKPPYRM